MRDLTIQEIETAQICGGLYDLPEPGCYDPYGRDPRDYDEPWSWSTWGLIAGGVGFLLLFPQLGKLWNCSGNDNPEAPPEPDPAPLLWNPRMIPVPPRVVDNQGAISRARVA